MNIKRARIEVSRPCCMHDASSHLKEIGEAIIRYAEECRVPAEQVLSVSLSATIEPNHSVTAVNISYSLLADPRNR